MTLIVVFLLFAVLSSQAENGGGAALAWAAAAVVGFGVRWWKRGRSYPAGRSVVHPAPHLSRRKRRLQRIEGEQLREQWPAIAEREQVNLPGSTVVNVTYGEQGAWSVTLQLLPGSTWRDAKRAAGALESVYRLPIASVEAAPIRADASRALLRFAADRPLEEERTWKGPQGERSILDPITLGSFQDGTSARASLAFVHWLIAGMSGSGKSVLLNRVVGEIAACHDAVMLGADLKDGLELTPWGEVADGGVFECITTTVEATEPMLERVVAELHRRGPLMRSLGWRKWQPSRQHPMLIVLVDEQGRLSDSERAKAALEVVAEQGRAKGVLLVSTFQKPTMDAFGSNRIRNNMDVTVCLRVFNDSEARVVFGGGANKAGWRPDEIDPDCPGTFYLLAAGSTQPRLARAENVPDALVERLASALSPRRPRLVPPPLVTARPGPPPVRHAAPAGLVPAQDTNREEQDGSGGGAAEDALAALVTGGGAEGASTAYLLTAMEHQQTPELRRKRAWTMDWLKANAVNVARGRWRLPTAEGDR